MSPSLEVSLEVAAGPMECRSGHFATIAPTVARQFRIGLPISLLWNSTFNPIGLIQVNLLVNCALNERSRGNIDNLLSCIGLLSSYTASCICLNTGDSPGQ